MLANAGSSQPQLDSAGYGIVYFAGSAGVIGGLPGDPDVISSIAWLTHGPTIDAHDRRRACCGRAAGSSGSRDCGTATARLEHSASATCSRTPPLRLLCVIAALELACEAARVESL
jgi:NADPH-dependent 2,4-dienoyl-CoA reductase/sulfur reductase-like enzyme